MDIDLPLVFALTAVLLVLLWWPSTRLIARTAVTALAAALLLMSMPAIPYAVDQALVDDRAFVASDLPDARAVVLMGAATTTVLGRAEDLRILTPVAAARVLETARVFRALKQPWVISSGGMTAPSRARQPPSLAMRDALVELGIPPDRIITESKSRTTYEEAVFITPLLKQLGAEPFVLVTSQSHMPRARHVFLAQGVRPIPAPAPDFPPAFGLEAGLTPFRPDSEGLRLSGALLHEWVGYGYYRWRGWLR